MGQATYVYPVTFTIPANVTAAVPHVVTPKLGNIWIDSIEIHVPPGNKGLSGIYVTNNGVAILPWATPPVWLQADAEVLRYDIDVEVDTLLQVFTYNTDVQAHLVQLRVIGRPMVVQNPTTAATAITPIAVAV